MSSASSFAADDYRRDEDDDRMQDVQFGIPRPGDDDEGPRDRNRHDDNIISLELKAPPVLSFHEMRLADLRRFQIKPVPGIPLNQQAPGVYLHPTEADMVVTVSTEPGTMGNIDTVAVEVASVEHSTTKAGAADDLTLTTLDPTGEESRHLTSEWLKRNLLHSHAFLTAQGQYRLMLRGRVEQRMPTLYLDHMFWTQWSTLDFQRGNKETLESFVHEITELVGDFREECKKALRPLVLTLGLGPSESRPERIVSELLADDAFLHPTPTHRFQASIIQGGLYELLIRFPFLRTMGSYPEEYPPPHSVPDRGTPSRTKIPVVAFVCATLHCCIKEWQHGTHTDLPFSDDSYYKSISTQLRAHHGPWQNFPRHIGYPNTRRDDEGNIWWCFYDDTGNELL
ncbi:hypothetical protein C8J56DRAFT_165483 [Mycena floridula]|nr:hypothetical protein C8J56DRAFT_165483 [Mycena floridula]